MVCGSTIDPASNSGPFPPNHILKFNYIIRLDHQRRHIYLIGGRGINLCIHPLWPTESVIIARLIRLAMQIEMKIR
jgi:hypothetical protein